MQGLSEHERYKPYNSRTIRDTPYWHKLTPALQEAMTVVARVMPFRTNEYVPVSYTHLTLPTKRIV